MINRISLLVEVMAIIVCLYALYGEKYRLGYKEIVLISVDLILMQSIDSGYINVGASELMFPLIALYCIWRFGTDKKRLIVNNILYIILLSGLQMLSFFLVSCILGEGANKEVHILCVNAVMLTICVISARKERLKRVSYYFQRDDIIMRCMLILGCSIILICIYMVKRSKGLYIEEYLFPAMATLVMCLMTESWQKYKLKAREKEMELQTYKLYETSYQNLISEIRLRQHEFNNHISAIYSQHLVCKSYEELVERQKSYCEEITYDNRYEKLLKAGDFALIGFLYGKFIEAEKRGIAVEYELKCMELRSSLPMFKMVELIGNLINNAMDALEKVDEKRIYVSITEDAEQIVIEVRNISSTISPKEITVMFQKGYSLKGENRGLGLYGLKKMGTEYHFEIICGNVLIEAVNWFSFSVCLNKSDRIR